MPLLHGHKVEGSSRKATVPSKESTIVTFECNTRSYLTVHNKSQKERKKEYSFRVHFVRIYHGCIAIQQLPLQVQFYFNFWCWVIYNILQKFYHDKISNDNLHTFYY